MSGFDLPGMYRTRGLRDDFRKRGTRLGRVRQEPLFAFRIPFDNIHSKRDWLNTEGGFLAMMPGLGRRC